MPNPIPSTLFPNVSTTAQLEVVFNTSDHASPTFPQLTTAEANPDTGDVRKMAYAILLQIQSALAGLSPAPSFMTGSTSVTDGGEPIHRRTLTFTFTKQTGGSTEVAPEA